LCLTGCDVAKENSDLIILDNNFCSIHIAIKWGRAIFDNVRKFIQF
jgi:magnesium-transporting ATPase (P-type)